MSSLTKLTLKRPVSVIIIMFGLLVFGFMSITGMTLELTPEMNMPMLVVVTIYPGAAPQDIEKLVTREVEGAAGSLSGVETIMSQTMENVSIVILQYSYGTNMDIAYTDLKEGLDLIENVMPDDARKPIVIELDINAMGTLYLSVTSDARDDLRYFVEDDIVPEFEKLGSVADVSVSGGETDYIRVEIDEQLMQQYGVSMATLTACVSTADFSIPTGTVDYGSQSLTVRSAIAMNTVEALGNIAIPLQSGDIIRLSDIAQVYTAADTSESVSRYNGYPNVGLTLQKRQTASAVQMSRDAMKVVEELNAADNGITIEVISDTSETIVSSITSVGSTLVAGIVISMAVLFIFLGDIKASLIVGSSMPVSLLVTFILMDMMGFTLNVLTMGGLVLGVGMMVDNSIVVLDSCFKTKTSQNTMYEAALEGTRFVTLSIVAGTLTTVVVFFPLASQPGLSGQLFTPLGFTIIISLTASLVSALTLVPLFFLQFNPRERRGAPAARILKRVELAYGHLLSKLLKRKFLVFIMAVVLLVVSLGLATQIDSELIPTTDEGTVSVSVEFRPGLRIERIDEILTEVEQIVAVHPDIDRYSVSAGSSGMMTLMNGGGSTGIYVYLKDDRAMSTQQVVELFRQQIAHITDCTINVSAVSTMSMASTDSVQVNLRGNNLDDLEEFSREISAIMEKHPDIIRVTSSMEGGSPQLEIITDPVKAAAYGLTPIQVAQSVYGALNGTNAVTITMDDQRYDVRIEYPDDKYRTMADLEDMVIVSPYGLAVPLTDIAGFTFSDSPQAIIREDNQYIVSIEGTPTYAARFSAYNEIMAQVNALEYPAGITPYESTIMEMMNEEFASIGKAIIIAIVLVFMVMGIQFESIKYSLMVMLTMPFSLIGSFLLLYLSGNTLSMPSLLGFLVLVGTVVNNGILFVDTTNQYRETMSVERALIKTGRTRLRPILMTTLTTVLSMVPMALELGSGTEMMAGMAMVVIGGLTAATLLTLLFLPTFYLIMDGMGRKERRFKPITGNGGSGPPVPGLTDPKTEDIELETDHDPVTV